jgi:hypothetical protein
MPVKTREGEIVRGDSCVGIGPVRGPACAPYAAAGTGQAHSVRAVTLDMLFEAVRGRVLRWSKAIHIVWIAIRV